MGILFGVATEDYSRKPLWVFGTHTDISTRKDEEQRRREIRESLIKRERDLLAIVKSIPGALVGYGLDTSGHITRKKSPRRNRF